MTIQQTEGFPTVTIRKLARICHRNLRRRDGWQPIGLLSEPGAGKSQFPKTVLRKLYAEFLSEDLGRDITADDIGVVVYHVAEKDAAESSGPGIPYRDEETGSYTFEFSQAPLITEINSRGREIDGDWQAYEFGICILEEYADADFDQQNVFAPLMDSGDNTLGDDPFPEGWIVIANGNRPDDRCGSMALSTKTPNRSKWYNLDFDFVGWEEDFAVPNQLNPVIIDWWRENHEEFRARTVPDVPGPFATNRSVTQASYDLDQIIDDPAFNGAVSDWEEADLSANLGISAGRSLVTHVRRMDQVPKPHEIFANPDGCPVSPLVGFQLIAASSAMSYIDDMDKADALLSYIMRLRTDLQIRLGVKLQEVLAYSDSIDSSVMGSSKWAEFDARFHKYLHLAS